MLFAFNSLNPMHEPIHTQPKRDKKKSKKITKKYCDNSIIKELFFFKKYKTIILPPELIDKILTYSIQLRDRDFINNTDYTHRWCDFRIPLFYHHILAPQQINLMQHLLTAQHLIKVNYINDPHSNGEIVHKELYYTLESKKDYKLFLTLPKNIRICLAQTPLSTLEEINRFNQHAAMDVYCTLKALHNPQINGNKAILVPSIKKAIINDIMIAAGLHKVDKAHECFCYYKEKSILPEEKTLKIPI